MDSFGPLDPQSILCVYKIVLRNACSSTWVSLLVRGCYCHFTTFKHLIDLGMKTEYDVEDTDVRCYYKIISPPLLRLSPVCMGAAPRSLLPAGSFWRQLEEPKRQAAKWIRYDDRIQKLCGSFHILMRLISDESC